MVYAGRWTPSGPGGGTRTLPSPTPVVGDKVTLLVVDRGWYTRCTSSPSTEVRFKVLTRVRRKNRGETWGTPCPRLVRESTGSPSLGTGWSRDVHPCRQGGGCGSLISVSIGTASLWPGGVHRSYPPVDREGPSFLRPRERGSGGRWLPRTFVVGRVCGHSRTGGSIVTTPPWTGKVHHYYTPWTGGAHCYYIPVDRGQSIAAP